MTKTTRKQLEREYKAERIAKARKLEIAQQVRPLWEAWQILDGSEALCFIQRESAMLRSAACYIARQIEALQPNTFTDRGLWHYQF